MGENLFYKSVKLGNFTNLTSSPQLIFVLLTSDVRIVNRFGTYLVHFVLVRANEFVFKSSLQKPIA